MMEEISNLEMGRAGEYFAIYELIKQGYPAFLSDQGLSYDIAVDVGGMLARGQVKSTAGHRDCGKSKNVLRFGARTGKGMLKNTSVEACDFYVFVSLDDKLAAFVLTGGMESATNEGFVKQTMDFRAAGIANGTKNINGEDRKAIKIMTMEDFADFTPVAERIKNELTRK